MKIYPFYLFIALLIANISLANDLSKLQQKITEQQQKINEQKKKKESLQLTLKTQETQISEVSSQLKNIELSLNDIRQIIRQTEKEIQRLEKQEKEQKERLKEQLDSAYRSGIHPSVIERLLSEEAKNADRISAYYEHINQVRIDAIHSLRQTQSVLKQKKEELIVQQKDQQKRLSDRKKQEKELKKVKNERETTVRSIDKSLQTEQGRLESLKTNEAELRQKLSQASHELDQREQQDIAKLEAKKNSEEKRQATEQEKQAIRSGNGLSGKYAMPVTGKIMHHFGSKKMGELKWDAIVIQTPAGTPVKSIANGKVVIAKWMTGYGFMVVVDHGKGEISLYGYNQSVAVSEGARVSAGQTIAYVGNTGGQDRSALYFAIRRKGVAVNPLKWVK